MKVSWLVIPLTLLFSDIGLVATGSADDADDIKRLVEDFYGALNDGDGEAVAKHYLEGANSFQRTGLLLAPVRSAEYLNARFEAGLKFQVEARHIDVKVHGGDAAVATLYTTGSTAYPSGATRNGTFRITIVWVKQASQWKMAHLHLSPLRTGME
jgi:uncharacterized protein (TIGR02246 family)